MAKTPNISESDTKKFKASKDWFEKFYKRSGIHHVARRSEAASSGKDGVEKFVGEFPLSVLNECYLLSQIF